MLRVNYTLHNIVVQPCMNQSLLHVHTITLFSLERMLLEMKILLVHTKRCMQLYVCKYIKLLVTRNFSFGRASPSIIRYIFLSFCQGNEEETGVNSRQTQE